jgi:hypothetical protein
VHRVPAGVQQQRDGLPGDEERRRDHASC